MKLSKTIDLSSKKRLVDLENKAKKYDFSSTNRFSKELLVFFENWGNNYSRLLSNSLLVRLRTNVKAHLELIHQMSYANYIEQNASDQISVVYNLPPLKGPFLLSFNHEFAGLSIDTLSGGNFGEGQALQEVTDVEKALIRILASYFLEGQQKCWQDYEPVNQKVRSVELNPSMIQLLPDNETVLVLEFMMEVGAGQFPLKLVIPHQSIENVIEKINKQTKEEEMLEQATEEERLFLEHVVKQLKVETVVELGKAQLSIEQTSQLREDCFIQLDRSIADLLTVYAEGVEIFKAQPVLMNGKLCIQVVEISETLETDLIQQMTGGKTHES